MSISRTNRSYKTWRIVAFAVALAVGGVLWRKEVQSQQADKLGGPVAATHAPIVFYGRILDQFGNAVDAATVKAIPIGNPSGSPSTKQLTSDSRGAFEVRGLKGLSLGIEVSKAGYRVIPPQDDKITSSGIFGFGAARQPYSTSPDVPAVFTLHKTGDVEPLIKVGERSFRIARDGAELRISLDNKGAHEVRLRCWTEDKQRPPGQQKYNWRFQIEPIDGSLARRNNDFEYVAPELGYMPSDSHEMLASQSRWDSFVERKYFIHFQDNTVARAAIRVRAGGDHFVVWESYFNPKVGSRNLENDPRADKK